MDIEKEGGSFPMEANRLLVVMHPKEAAGGRFRRLDVSEETLVVASASYNQRFCSLKIKWRNVP